MASSCKIANARFYQGVLGQRDMLVIREQFIIRLPVGVSREIVGVFLAPLGNVILLCCGGWLLVVVVKQSKAQVCLMIR